VAAAEGLTSFYFDVRAYKKMTIEPSYHISTLGDSALLIHFDNRIDEAINNKVLSLFKRLKDAGFPFSDVVPAYSSVAIHYDVLKLRTKQATAFQNVKAIIEPLLADEEISANSAVRQIPIPVCYAEKFAPDIHDMAVQKNISVEEIIRLHTTTSYRVYMIGFLPGFAYMGTVDERISMQRKSQPRTSVTAGSVGIAGEQTGIYPLTSPGGWNIIGRTPLKIFDATKEDAVLFHPGDEVSFYSITEDEFENYKGRNF
jgi:inhibitor of KinA